MSLKNRITDKLHALVESEPKKVVMNMQQYQDSADELPDDTVVKIVDEAEINEVRGNDKKIEKLVGVINQLIAAAVEPDGTPLEVVDKSGTWEEPAVYKPIIYRNGVLKIIYQSPYSSEPKVETILKRNMEFDGIPTLLNIKKLYNRAIKRAALDNEKMYNRTNRSGDVEAIGEDVDANKLALDVQKFMDKLNLGQFQSLFAKIDKPVEQAEIIAAFAERIGIPRTKLPMILQSLKTASENINPKMKKSDLVEHVLNTKKNG